MNNSAVILPVRTTFLVLALTSLLSAAGQAEKKHDHKAHGHLTVPTQKPSPPPKGFEKVDIEIDIETLRGQMRYDLDSFRVSPGEKVKLTLQNSDDMPHNLVICKPTNSDIGLEVSKKAWNLGSEGIAKQYVPDHPAILFSTTLVAPRSTAVFYFEAPKTTGRYPYVCTLPGHVFYMKGTMLVEKSMKTPDGKPIGPSAITMKVYEGSWDRLPDFEKIEPSREEKLSRGKLISNRLAKKKDNFALLFEGVISVPNSGRYSFELASDDGSRLEVNNQRIIDHDGIHKHSPKTGGINLKPGSYPFKLSYFQRNGPSSLSLRWRGPSVRTAWLTRTVGKGPSIPILPEKEGEAVIYRNFIAGSGTRSIGVGYPQSVNIAFDANAMRLAMLWQGAFMDGNRHWNGRGQGFQAPAGYAKIDLPKEPSFAFLESPDTSWPKLADYGRASGFRFLGYERDKQRRPKFLYEFENLRISDFPQPKVELIPQITRKINIEGNSGNKKLHYLAAVGAKITKEDDGYAIDEKYKVDFPEGAKEDDPILRSSGGRQELLLPITVAGKLSFSQRYRWIYR